MLHSLVQRRCRSDVVEATTRYSIRNCRCLNPSFLSCGQAVSMQRLKPNTHHRRRRDLTVELSRVGGVNAPVGSCDPVYNFL